MARVRGNAEKVGELLRRCALAFVEEFQRVDERAGKSAEHAPGAVRTADAAEHGELALGELVVQIFHEIGGRRRKDDGAIPVDARREDLAHLADRFVGKRTGEDVEAGERENELTVRREIVERCDENTMRRSAFSASPEPATELRDLNRRPLHFLH